ncbi:MAG TPA: NAD(P)H-quinone oxidoreductase [Puia sp.]|nr:NAD(P)H-quinone oxidoreductase [Puia sp.]
MKAIWITTKGGPDVLEIRDTADPVPAYGEVLIKVKAAGLNRSDIYSRQSRSYGNDRPEIPGLEISGTIIACAEGVTRWKPGDEVCSLTTGGGYAEYAAVPAGQCLPVPDGWTLEEAASLPETVLTVWSNVWRTAGLRPGEILLVHGGTSGIGSMAIQLAVALGNPIYTTAGTEEKCRWCEALGATRAVNYKTADFEQAFQDTGVDVILDITGGDFTPRNLRLLKNDGRMVFINAMRGKDATIDLTAIMSRRLVITGSMLKPRSAAFKAELTADVEKRVWPLVARGAVRPLIEARFPLDGSADAQRLMESGQHRGKILLVIS